MTFIVSPDGYVRSHWPLLRATRLIHHYSGLNDDPVLTRSAGAIRCEITGYTEWVDEVGPIITIGWDWQMVGGHRKTALARLGEPRSNIMVLHHSGVDLPAEENLDVLADYIDAFDWQSEVVLRMGLLFG